MAPPNQPNQLIQRAIAALQRKAWSEAVELANTVLERFGPEANALMVLASVRAEEGDLQAACALYEQARALMPTHIHVLVNLASIYRATGRFQEARRALHEALHVDRGFAITHNNLGNLLIDLGERLEARLSYERAAALDPRYADPVSGLASIAEQEHRLAEARSLAERALQLAPKNVLARLTLARVEIRQHDTVAATTILEALLSDDTLPVTNRILAQGSLGEAYDKLGRYNDAHTAFSRANALQHEQCEATFQRERGPLTPASVARLTAFVAGADPCSWRPAPPSERSPVFLVGFPRSGTTLLDQILASHADVTTLEERDTLLDAANELIAPDGAFERWADLANREIERLRERYWQRVRTASSSLPLTRVFLDKQPLNAVLLPLIHRLFPAAKILFAVRDPRDVVLSCYQQRFGMNVAMYQLLRLDTATAYYDAVMRIVEVSRGKLPLRLHVVKYEDVVSKFEATMRGVIAFLELDWDQAVHRYAETAKRRTINTPSAAQVVSPLYGSARGRWRHYSTFLEPYFPALMPWIKAFEYETQ